MSFRQEILYKINIKSWIIYYSESNLAAIRLETDKIFSDYSFYPEAEWKYFGIRPPESHQVLGAWRYQDSSNKYAFGFLLNNPNMYSVEKDFTSQLIIYVIADRSEILNLTPKIQNLKKRFSKNDQKEKTNAIDDNRLDHISNTKSFPVLPAVLGIFTIIINAISLYLRKIPPPQNCNVSFVKAYFTVIGIINFSALFLLFLVIIICIVILLKYAFLLIKRL